jgi:hypothetical protein
MLPFRTDTKAFARLEDAGDRPAGLLAIGARRRANEARDRLAMPGDDDLLALRGLIEQLAEFLLRSDGADRARGASPAPDFSSERGYDSAAGGPILYAMNPIITWSAALEMHRSAATGLAQHPLDLAGWNPEDLGDLRDGHAVLQPDAYPGNL